MQKSLSRCLVFVLSVSFMISSLSLAAQKAVPELWGQRVHDEAKVLKQSTVDSLETILKTYEDSTSNQLAILIVKTLDGETIEDFSIRVAEKWKLGTAKNDNGVLLIAAVDDHKVRIEVGDGLQDRLTDARTSQIIRDEILPNFRRSDYAAGIADGVDAIVKTIANEYTVTADASTGTSNLTVGEKIAGGIFVLGLLFLFTWFGLFSSGCWGWGMYVFLIPFYFCFPWLFIGMVADLTLLSIFVIGFPIAKIVLARTAWGKKRMMTMKSGGGLGGGGGGGFRSGGGSSWSSGSGSSFSGGGGSFSGGGSSGSW